MASYNENELITVLKQIAEGLGFELSPEKPLDARTLRRLDEPKTVKEMLQRTTLKVTRYTLAQIRAECPPAMTTDAFLQQLIFLYKTVKNKGVLLDLK